MRNLRYILFHTLPAVVIAMTAAVGCINDPTADVSYSAPGDMTLTLTTSSAVSTRADNIDNGEDVYHENLINRAQLFFYPVEYDGEGNRIIDDKVEAVYSCVLTDLDATIHKDVSVRLNAKIRAELFGENESKSECRVFAVVNCPENVPIAADATVEAIKNTVVTTEFRVENATEPEHQIMSEFVMFGEGIAEFDDDERKSLSGRIYLKRTAAKIRLALSIKDLVIDTSTVTSPDDGTTETKTEWTPLIEGIRIYITNGVKKAQIGGGQINLDTEDYYNISASTGQREGTVEGENLEPYPDDSAGGDGDDGSSGGENPNYKSDYEVRARQVYKHPDIPETLKSSDPEKGDYCYWHDIPFYTYPHKWSNDPDEEHQTYLVLQIPWQVEGESVYKTFFYQIPVNLRGGKTTNDGDNDGSNEHTDDHTGLFPGPTEDGRIIDGNTIESNMYYLIKLHVGMLGSFNPEKLDIEADYYIVPWQQEDIKARLTDNRYLVVNQQEWTMHNTSDVDIQFYSSHPTVVARVKYKFWNFNPVGVRYDTQGNEIGYYTYYDDGETYTIDHEGEPLHRTIKWMNPIGYIFNSNSTNTNKTDKISESENSVYDKSLELAGEPIFSWSIDNENYIISYHHDLVRWTEYVNPVNGTPQKLFDKRITVPYTRNSSGVTAKYNGTDTDKKEYYVDGFYGKFNGTADIDGLGTAYLLKTQDDEGNIEPEWSRIDVEITIIHKDLFEDPTIGLDNTRFQQTIYITQYPPMYVEAELSAQNYTFVNGKIEQHNFGGSGWNQDVADAKKDENGDWFRYSYQSREIWEYVNSNVSTNNNPNMYVVTISQLGTEDADVQIGDPRMLTINNNLSNESFTETDKESNHYPTKAWLKYQSNGNRTVVDDFGNNTIPNYTISGGAIFRTGEEISSRGNYPNQRERYVHEWRTNAPTKDAALYGTSPRQLADYYPTDETKTYGSKENFVAPKLRIASSYGNIGGQIGIVEARRRCAAYQENGYPAGRWRMPTQAEIQFITQLSSKGRIPLLFTPWNEQAIYQGKPIVHGAESYEIDHSDYKNYPHYWCAQGAAYIDATDNYKVKIRENATTSLGNAQQVAVRCVYDEWYWTDKCPVNQFTWGDKPKSNPQGSTGAVKGIVNLIKNK